jgi:hypothetical protein
VESLDERGKVQEQLHAGKGLAQTHAPTLKKKKKTKKTSLPATVV